LYHEEASTPTGAKMSHIQDAFHKICTKAKPTEDWFVCLMETATYYGGPEEGGWWGQDTTCIQYQRFNNKFDARKAKKRIELLAQKMNAESKKAFGNKCLKEMDFCDQRYMEYDALPEVDGEESYSVILSQSIPQDSKGCRHYE
jgi:hypothetical protein